LAVSGGIAAFKALAVLRLLKRHGADPFVVMTPHATQFMAPDSFAMWSGHPVSTDLFAPLKTWDMEHIALAHGAELVLVVPATANFLTKLATGVADDLLSTLMVVLADRAPVFLAKSLCGGRRKSTGAWWRTHRRLSPGSGCHRAPPRGHYAAAPRRSKAAGLIWPSVE
jgi:hypothetical protein